jgi:DNA-binding transcriptional ArsR family regulator
MTILAECESHPGDHLPPHGQLKAAGLVEPSKQGIWIYYRLREQLPALTTELLATLVEPLAEAAMAGSTARPS